MSQTTLLRLMTLLSPTFPVGGFAYSSGLEQAVADHLVNDQISLGDWLTSIVRNGAVWNDCVLVAETHRRVGAGEPILEMATLAAALAGSKERWLEQSNLGGAFIDTVRASGLELPLSIAGKIAYTVAIGAVSAAQGLDCESALIAFVHAFVSNQIQCAIRLGVLGQNGGVALLARFEGLILETAHSANISTLDDLGASSLMADISSMRHETLYSRIFRS